MGQPSLLLRLYRRAAVDAEGAPSFARARNRALRRASVRMRRSIGLAVSVGLLAVGCVQAAQRYPLRSGLDQAASTTGTLSVERVEGGQRLVVVQLRELPPPERIAPGLREFVVWLSSPSGTPENAGALEYDREHQSGSLFATTNLGTFIVTVTGEREPGVRTPSGVLLAERKVVTN